MRRSDGSCARAIMIAVFAGALGGALTGCGGGGDLTTPEPPGNPQPPTQSVPNPPPSTQPPATPLTAATVTLTPTAGRLTSGDTLRLALEARDANRQPITGHTATWTSSDSAVAAVDSAGLVHARGAGTATITATVDTATGTAALTVVAGAASRLVLTARPTGGTAESGRRLDVAPVVQIADEFGNPVAQADVPVELTLSPTPQPGGTSYNNDPAPKTDAAGSVRFDKLAITGQPGAAYTVRFSAAGLAPVDLGPLTLTAPQPALEEYLDYCTTGAVRACFDVRVQTTPLPNYTTRLEVAVRNLQGSHPVDNTGGSAVFTVGLRDMAAAYHTELSNGGLTATTTGLVGTFNAPTSIADAMIVWAISDLFLGEFGDQGYGFNSFIFGCDARPYDAAGHPPTPNPQGTITCPRDGLDGWVVFTITPDFSEDGGSGVWNAHDVVVTLSANTTRGFVGCGIGTTCVHTPR